MTCEVAVVTVWLAQIEALLIALQALRVQSYLKILTGLTLAWTILIEHIYLQRKFSGSLRSRTICTPSYDDKKLWLLMFRIAHAC